MKCLQYFALKNAIKHERRFAFAVIPLLWIGLLAFPNLPIAVASEASAESPSSLELAATQTVSYGAASTLNPAAPFTMIILCDPQFGWEGGLNHDMCWEQWQKVRTIEKIYNGKWFKFWPLYWEFGNNYAFEREKQYSEVPDLKGVIINGDLTYTDDPLKVLGMQGYHATGIIPMTYWPLGTSRNLFYRDFYVDYLDDHCDDLPVYAGFGNHDNQYTLYDLACALTLDEEYEPGGAKWDPFDAYKRRLWTNFPSSGISYDFNRYTKKGSLSYSWDIGNYHFVQGNNLHSMGTLPLGDKWLDGMVVESPVANGWLQADIEKATNASKKIILNVHGQYFDDGDWSGFEKIPYGNIVAVFRGHFSNNEGLCVRNGYHGYYHVNDTAVINNFGQKIPVFQPGHSRNFVDSDGNHWKTDHRLLIVECADDYMNVGLIDCGDWGDEDEHAGFRDATNSNYMMTLKWVNTPPVAKLTPVSSPFDEGQEVSVTGYFTDGSIVTSPPLILDTWNSSTVKYGDNTTCALSYDDSGTGKHPFDLIHVYGDNDEYTIKVNVTDRRGESSVAECSVTVLNEDPIVETISHHNATVFEGAPVTVTATFTDPGFLDTHTATVAWGDGNVTDGQVVEDKGSGTVIATHTYSVPGSYNYTVTVTDDDGGQSSMGSQITVIVALSGFVTDEYYDKPLAGVTITCDGKTTTTDANGYYEITPLDPGDYSVSIMKPGYNSIVPNKTATIIAGQETIVNFAAYPLPDIIFTKATVDTERLAGDTITYHITVDNQGDGPATNIVITDVLPSMTTFISSDHSCAIGQTVTWSIGTMSEHSSTTIELTVRISLLVYPDTILNNPVTVDFDDWYELPQTPETASATTVILPTVATENIQGVGYWQRQIKAVQANKPCDYTESELLLLLEKIRVSSQVFGSVYTLENAADLLATPTGKDTMETRATQQLLALWLNLAARAVAADTPLDLADLTTATTIAEAITQCEAILLDPAHTKATCECSKEICDQLNNCHGLPW